MGRHRKKVPVLRLLARYGLIVSAVTVLLLTYLSQPVAISNSAEIPHTPPVDKFTLDSQPTTISSSPAKTKNKKTRQAARSPVLKIEKDQAVTPEDPPSIKPVKTSAPRPRQVPVRSATPTAGKVRSSPVVQRQVITKSVAPKSRETIKTSDPTSKAPPKAAIKTTSVARVVSAPVIPKPKPQTVVAPPPAVPVLTSNSKCSNIGLQPTPKAACNTILAAFPQVQSVLGVGGRAGNPNSCHPKGLAIDLIVGTNKALGDKLFAFVIARRSALGATPVVLWQVPDHFDHVHVSFSPCKG